MINIISRAYLSKSAGGPKKVVDNLIKGLDLLGYPYIINKSLDCCGRLYIHDDACALAEAVKLPADIKIIAGPNLYVLPRHIPREIDLSRVVYLQPSQWAKDFWTDFGFNRCPIEIWPVGIDTDDFKPGNGEKKFVLVYFKQREREELDFIKKTLERKNTEYVVLEYGYYKESDYKKMLDGAKYIVWLGRQESQGIALEEALASGVPALVCDVNRFGQWRAGKKEMAMFTEKENDYGNVTSAHYFDETCGIKIKDLKDFDGGVDLMNARYQSFSPRGYILNNLNLKKQSRELIEFYGKHFNLNYESGLSEQACSSGDWINNSRSRVFRARARDFLKSARVNLRNLLHEYK